MRKILFILPLIFMLGCSSFSDKKGVDDFDQYVLGEKSGAVWLRDGQIITFEKSVVTCTFKTIRVFSETVHYTFLWTNVDKIYIYHYKPTKERVLSEKNKRGNKNIGEKIIDSGIKVKSN